MSLLLAQSCRTGMSAIRSLPRVNRTLAEGPDSVEIDPERTSEVAPTKGPSVVEKTQTLEQSWQYTHNLLLMHWGGGCFYVEWEFWVWG